jgi:hypothetical protein
MTIKCDCFLLAEYAGTSADGKLTIAGTVDGMSVQRPPQLAADAPFPVVLPRAYVAVVTEASLADGLTQQFRLRLLDGNGQDVMDEVPIEVNYALNPFGRPMRNNLVISINMLGLPGPDDYVFVLSVDGTPGRLAEQTFAVVEVPGQANG